MALVALRDVKKSYRMGHGIVHALRGVALDVHAGESLAIMGASGSGKSTLMHLIGCLDQPTEGSYFLNGVDISGLRDAQLSLLRATQIGFVFQSFNLIPQLNVYENVEVPFLYRKGDKLSHAEIRQKILQSIERVGLAHRVYHLPTELSGGEMQRVAIARALAIDPLLILADEPTGNLDSQTGRTILGLFSELNQQGVTIILVTHDRAVGEHCQRLITMKDGYVL